ncbi:hypothetical protein CASFOL_008925 [Castilleja foliolosa]|uniref:Peptidase A1 domain-containing protein n=1 Tax=Castilleja foliolosa TaxID=1961234 RepID=A0ABD3E1T4_9LAMI
MKSSEEEDPRTSVARPPEESSSEETLPETIFSDFERTQFCATAMQQAQGYGLLLYPGMIYPCNFLVCSTISNSEGRTRRDQVRLPHCRNSLQCPEHKAHPPPLRRVAILPRQHNPYRKNQSSGPVLIINIIKILVADKKNTTSIRPRLDSQAEDRLYMIEVGIGTFTPPHPRNYNYFLHLDTGSDFTWTQCDECRKTGSHNCFKQKPPLFPSASSTSYSPLPCNEDELCTPGECIGSKCSYGIEYADGARLSGYLARETFTFASSNGDNKTEQVKGHGLRVWDTEQGFHRVSKG